MNRESQTTVFQLSISAFCKNIRSVKSDGNIQYHRCSLAPLTDESGDCCTPRIPLFRKRRKSSLNRLCSDKTCWLAVRGRSYLLWGTNWTVEARSSWAFFKLRFSRGANWENVGSRDEGPTISPPTFRSTTSAHNHCCCSSLFSFQQITRSSLHFTVKLKLARLSYRRQFTLETIKCRKKN